MADATQIGPGLKKLATEPKGVLQKNMKALVFLGASLLVIVAAIFSAGGRKSAAQATKSQPPQPVVFDNTASNIADLKDQVAAEQQKQAEALAAAPADPVAVNAAESPRAAATEYTPAGVPVGCIPGQPCPPAGYSEQAGGSGQVSPAEQEAEQLAAQEREREYESRFASNIAYSQPAAAAPAQNQQSAQADPYANALTAAQQPGSRQSGTKRAAEVNIDSASGQPYVVYEGTILNCVLMNRLDGDAPGPVKALVSMPLYSHDFQHVLVPAGTVVLGEARKIGSAGFGQQRRLAVTFHRMIMPDGYSVDLDQFQGLDQSGSEGLKDKVNNHYLQIFGTSIALGVISGAGEIEEGGGTFTTSGSQAFATGASASVSQSATTVLDRLMEIPPTITIREGHRIKIYFSQDMLLPAYNNHTIPQSF